LRAVYIDQFGEEEIRNHMADTRDTLCYATNDNQTSTYALVEAKPDIAIVIGGHNSSNTTHLVEILEQNMPTFFIQGASDILSLEAISSFDIHEKKLQKQAFLPSLNPLRIAITSGASCPDSVVDQVMTKLLMLMKEPKSIEEVLQHAE
jgi:4-hydroxy-3-methylbut-2-enyl diphosphate reductase